MSTSDGGRRRRARRLAALVLLVGLALAVPWQAAAAALPLREGMRGPEVRQVQERLRALGFYRGPLDGIFGPATREAVRRFQAARGLPQVGYVGPGTWAALQPTAARRDDSRRPVPQTREAAAGARGSRGTADPARETARPPLPPPDDGGGRLALTFDDGPDPRTLPAILAALAEAGVRATFFVVGRDAAAHPELVRLLAARGHEVENHGYTHEPAVRLRSGALQREIARTAELIRAATGRPSRFYRPAGGEYSGETVAAARAAGHRLILWTNIGAPDVPYPGEEERLVQRLAAAGRGGAIVMLHADRPETAAALPAVLRAWHRRGVQVVPLGELLGTP